MQHKILERHPLLDEKGEVIEAGYANSLILHYDRNQIKASKWRIKEWDYYLISNGRYAIALTIADNSYMGLDSISFLDLGEKPWQQTISKMQAFTFGRKNFPKTSEIGNVSSKGKKHSLEFLNDGNRRILKFEMENFIDKKPIKGVFELQTLNDDSMVIVIPYKEDKKAFYYNQKLNCIPTYGKVEIGDEIIEFNKEDTFAVLDWGRGVWLRKGVWYWGSCSTLLEGERFGFNIGYGFGDTSAASENMIFYKGKAHKLDQIEIHIPKNQKNNYDYMKTWKVTSSDKRFEMTFEPIIDRSANLNVLIIGSNQHQVFGKISGTCILDDGKVLEIKDAVCFIERLVNKW